MPRPATRFGRPNRRLLLLVLLTIVAMVRGAAIASQWPQLARDPDGYRLIAENLLRRVGYSSSSDPTNQHPQPTAFRPPLYPLSLALVGWRGHVLPLAVAALHVVLGTLTVLLVYWLGRAWQLGSWSWLAAALVAVDPILLNQSAQVMTETLATFLAALVLLAMTSWSNRDFALGPGICAGLLLGFASLCRPTFLIFAAFSVLYAAAGHPALRRGMRAAVLAGALVIVLMPWGIRNRHALGKFVVTTTHGGYTLLLGNNRFFYQHLREQPWGEVWDAAPLQRELAGSPARQRSQGRPAESLELVQDRHDYQLARQAIRDEPNMFAYATLVRIGRLWSPVPHRLSPVESWLRRGMRYAIASWYLATLVGALWGAVAMRHDLRRPPWVWALLLCAAFTLVHSVYWSNMRMRAPLMPAVYLVAVSALANRSARRRWESS